MEIGYYDSYLDSLIEKRLDMIGAIVIVGPKWCGKTTAAKRHVKSISALNNPDTFESYVELASFKASKLLEGEKPLLIDEWQNLPVLWML